MSIEVKIEKDSIGPAGIRLTTFILKYPRFIHSELMTHRAFSRNASSSRAIPFKKQIEMIKQDTAMPLSFRANQKGMQAGEELKDQNKAIKIWERARDAAIEQAVELDALGAHKQYVNRLIEPYSHITVVLTSSQYSNFFALRYHSAAQPEIAELAKQMWEIYEINQPQVLGFGGWHLPFVSDEEYKIYKETNGNTWKQDLWLPLIKRSVARCARVSYNNHDGTSTTQDQDDALYDRLLGAQPIHASPAEHQARTTGNPNYVSGNFRGWKQFRKTLTNENIEIFEGPIG